MRSSRPAKSSGFPPRSPWLVVLGSLLALFALFAPFAVVACSGCRNPRTAGPVSDAGLPTLRLYVVSDVGGALEPCGCMKDQLGGIDRAATLLRGERVRAPSSLLVAAGPTFFSELSLEADRKVQDVARAETLAVALGRLGLAAFSPGKSDFAAGPGALSAFAKTTGGAMLVANVVRADGAPIDGAASFVLREVGGVRVGLIGASALATSSGTSSDGPKLEGLADKPLADAVRGAVEALKKQSADVLVVLGAVGRGEAKRLADAVPELTVIAVGSRGPGGEQDREAAPPERVGTTLVVEPGNHLQSIAIVSLFIRDGGRVFADGNGQVPEKGSYFRYSLERVTDTLPRDEAVSGDLRTYYKKVNDHNRVAFAGRLPLPAPASGAKYLGIDVCSGCHKPARRAWDATRHAHAYESLSTQFKEFNLDCVSCHVTGYDRPGGSTVTQVDKLKGVQCESCHGPGGKHVATGLKADIVLNPKDDVCLACHRPPHVSKFDVAAHRPEILGPGHGKK